MLARLVCSTNRSALRKTPINRVESPLENEQAPAVSHSPMTSTVAGAVEDGNRNRSVEKTLQQGIAGASGISYALLLFEELRLKIGQLSDLPMPRLLLAQYDGLP